MFHAAFLAAPVLAFSLSSGWETTTPSVIGRSLGSPTPLRAVTACTGVGDPEAFAGRSLQNEGVEGVHRKAPTPREGENDPPLSRSAQQSSPPGERSTALPPRNANAGSVNADPAAAGSRSSSRVFRFAGATVLALGTGALINLQVTWNAEVSEACGGSHLAAPLVNALSGLTLAMLGKAALRAGRKIPLPGRCKSPPPGEEDPPPGEVPAKVLVLPAVTAGKTRTVAGTAKACVSLLRNGLNCVRLGPGVAASLLTMAMYWASKSFERVDHPPTFMKLFNAGQALGGALVDLSGVLEEKGGPDIPDKIKTFLLKVLGPAYLVGEAAATYPAGNRPDGPSGRLPAGYVAGKEALLWLVFATTAGSMLFPFFGASNAWLGNRLQEPGRVARWIRAGGSCNTSCRRGGCAATGTADHAADQDHAAEEDHAADQDHAAYHADKEVHATDHAGATTGTVGEPEREPPTTPTTTQHNVSSPSNSTTLQRLESLLDLGAKIFLFMLVQSGLLGMLGAVLSQDHPHPAKFFEDIQDGFSNSPMAASLPGTVALFVFAMNTVLLAPLGGAFVLQSGFQQGTLLASLVRQASEEMHTQQGKTSGWWSVDNLVVHFMPLLGCLVKLCGESVGRKCSGGSGVENRSGGRSGGSGVENAGGEEGVARELPGAEGEGVAEA